MGWCEFVILDCAPLSVVPSGNHVFLRCILNSLVRMMNKSCQIICSTYFKGLMQSVEIQLRIDVAAEFHSDTTSAEYINDHGQKYEFFRWICVISATQS